MRSSTTPMVNSSGTRCPASTYSLALSPRAVPPLIAQRKMSPVEIAGIPYFSAMRADCVPFPAPWGPKITSRTSTPSLKEPFVVTHHQLRLDLFHSLERDADRDQ